MQDKLSTYCTTYATHEAGGSVHYHKTEIVRWTAGNITLRSGGWETVTTKRKMNQASRQFGLGYSVWQRDWQWFVGLPNGETMPFKDGMTFARGL